MNVELEKLEKRISELEAIVKKDSVNAFGRAYSTAGSSNSDFLIKTKGQVKIQWGNKFIDLIKDGKINVNSKFIYTDTEVGSKDGIYVITNENDSKVILQVNGQQIVLYNSESSEISYVSFLTPQQTTSDEKYTALKNIGFVYDTLNDIDESAVYNGVVYVTDKQSFYTITNGKVSEFSIKLPDVINKSLTIKKSDSTKGALIIDGEGINNSLTFQNSYIYMLNNFLFIDSKNNIVFKIYDKETVVFSDTSIKSKVPIISDNFQSNNISDESGFELSYSDGESTLKIDNLIVRKKQLEISDLKEQCPTYWNYLNNIILKVTVKEEKEGEGEGEEISKDTTSESYLNNIILQLQHKNKYTVGQYLYTYILIENTSDTTNINFYDRILIPFSVQEVDEQLNTITVNVLTNLIDSNTISKLSSTLLKSGLVNKTLFLVASNLDLIYILKQENNNMDLIESEVEFLNEKESIKYSILSRYGNLDELNLKYKDQDQEHNISGYGLFANQGIFDSAFYSVNYNLSEEDNSSRLSSTEWVNKKLYNLIPKGSIIMYNGLASEIPDGWGICDGTNGTPNLINKFIKAASSSGAEEGQEEIQLTIENLPTHTHQLQPTSISTSINGSHSHNYTAPISGNSSYSNEKNIMETSTSETTEISGEHSHIIDLSAVTILESGEGKPLRWEPKHYSLIFIMKLS